MVKAIDYSTITERRCSSCRETKPVAEFYKKTDPKQPINGWRYDSRCRACSNQQSRAYGAGNKPKRNARLQHWRASNPELARAKDRRARIKATYGLTEDEATRLHAAFDGLCWLCRRRAAIAIDHDHTTGSVRGMTCRPCNITVLAFADADPTYLARVMAYQTAGDAMAFLQLPLAELMGGAA